MELGDDSGHLSYPTTLSSEELRSVAPPAQPSSSRQPSSASAAARTKAKSAGRKPAPPRAAARSVGARVPTSALGGGRATAEQHRRAADATTVVAAGGGGCDANAADDTGSVAPRALGRDDSPFGAPRSLSDADPMSPSQEDAVDVGDDLGLEDAAGASVEVPAFSQAHWEALRPERPSLSRPATARARVGGGTPRLGSASALGGGLGSHSGVIISTSVVGSPRRPKSDPVSMHARRQAQWQSDSFLSLGKSKRTGPPIEPPPPLATVRGSRRRVNTYVVPTTKRRDDLVWETRLRMRHTDSDAGGLAARTRSKPMVPNTFVPATEKRRDDLRWAVRAEMAYSR